MMGRAAFGDPWVFRRVRSRWAGGETLPMPTAAERLEAGIRHLAMLVATSGEAIAAKEMRKHVAWYIKGLPNSARVREQVNHTRSAAELSERLRDYLETLERDGLAAFAPEAPPLMTGVSGATG
jgi:tRNA-dihydrouridine synthase B